MFSRRWLGGRLVLNGWRIARGEVKLSRFMLEDCVHAVLGVSIARPSDRATTELLTGRSMVHAPGLPVDGVRGSGSGGFGGIIEILSSRCAAVLQVLSRMDVIGRSCEMANLLGIELEAVLRRGSQYRVEAVMLRIARPLGLVAPSPHASEVAQ